MISNVIRTNAAGGTQEDWTKVVIYTNAGETGARYAEIKWNRDECGQGPGFIEHPKLEGM